MSRYDNTLMCVCVCVCVCMYMCVMIAWKSCIYCNKTFYRKCRKKWLLGTDFRGQATSTKIQPMKTSTDERLQLVTLNHKNLFPWKFNRRKFALMKDYDGLSSTTRVYSHKKLFPRKFIPMKIQPMKICTDERFWWATLNHEIYSHENLTHKILWPQKFLHLRCKPFCMLRA